MFAQRGKTNFASFGVGNLFNFFLSEVKYHFYFLLIFKFIVTYGKVSGGQEYLIIKEKSTGVVVMS